MLFLKSKMKILFFILLLVLQYLGYLYSIKKSNSVLKWLSLILPMLIYYVAVLISYNNAVQYFASPENHNRCGMWILGFFFLFLFNQKISEFS